MAAHSEAEHSDATTSHPADRPEDWGFHGEFGKWARFTGWIVVAILLVMITATHYNKAGGVSLIATAAGLIVALLWDRNRRRTSWRQ